MPGFGAAAKEGGSSHCNLAGSACLEDGSSFENQKAARARTNRAEPARNHWLNFMMAFSGLS